MKPRATITPESPLKTACWLTPIPAAHMRINIARGSIPVKIDPRAFTYVALMPMETPENATPAEVQRRYLNQLANLDPEFVFHHLRQLAGDNRTPVLVSWEKPKDIAAGSCGSHRHLIAQWLEVALDIRCEEIGYPRLDRFKFWNAHPAHLAPPMERPRTGPQPKQPPSQRTIARTIAKQLDLFSSKHKG